MMDFLHFRDPGQVSSLWIWKIENLLTCLQVIIDPVIMASTSVQTSHDLNYHRKCLHELCRICGKRAQAKQKVKKTPKYCEKYDSDIMPDDRDLK